MKIKMLRKKQSNINKKQINKSKINKTQKKHNQI